MNSVYPPNDPYVLVQPPPLAPGHSDEDMLRFRFKYDLKMLCHAAFKYKDWSANPDMHLAISRHIRRSSKFKLFLLPRDHLKSSIITKAGAVLRMLQNFNTRILIANNTWDNARKFLRSIQEHLVRGQMLPQFFGPFESKHWNQDEITIRQRNVILDAPTIATTGLEKEQTSQHYDLIIADDLVARENVQTPEQRNKVKDYINSLMALLEPNGELWVVGTRWSMDDAYGDLLEEGVWDVLIRSCYTDETRTTPLFPEKFTLEKLQFLRQKLGPTLFSCTPGDTPILMSDWTFKKISEIRVGDKVVGWTHGGPQKSRLVETDVQGIFSREQAVNLVRCESGRFVRCTSDHNWYTGRFEKRRKLYMPAKVGRRIFFVDNADPDTIGDSICDWNYLAGLFDGEGSCGSGGCLTIAQSEKANPDVCQRIVDVLKRLKIDYSIWEKPDNYRGKVFVLKNSRRVARNLIRFTNCGKRNRLIKWLYKYGSNWCAKEDKIVSIEPHGVETVYGMQTGTKNYVAWGYASSNCWYLNNPISQEAADFKQEWIKFYAPGTPHPAQLYLAVDPAHSLSRDADYSAFVVAGMFANRTIRVVDYVRKRVVPSDLVDIIFDLVKKWGLHRVGIETFAFQKTLKYEIQRKQRETGKFFGIDELGRRDSGGRAEPFLSKEARIRSLQPLFEQGLIELRSDMQDFVDELLAFPRGKYDDCIDALAYIPEKLLPSQGLLSAQDAQEFFDKDTKKWSATMNWWVKNKMPKPAAQSIYERYFADLK